MSLELFWVLTPMSAARNTLCKSYLALLSVTLRPYAHILCRLFVLLSGLAHITLPSSSDEAWVMEGINGLLVAADMDGTGHYTTYPSDKETVALQIPFHDGVVPSHRVMKPGPCHGRSQVVSSGVEVGTRMSGHEL